MRHEMLRTTTSLCAVLILLLVALAIAGEERMFDPVFREGRPSDVLHEGPPPLLRSQIDAYVDLLEAAFDLVLRPSDEQDLRDALEGDYAGADESARRELAVFLAPRAALGVQARSGDAAAVRKGLGTFRQALDHRLTTAPGTPVHGIVRRVLARRREVAWPGTPPIGAPAADAWLDLVEFVVSLGRNEDYEPTDGQTEVLRRDLGVVLHGQPEAVRSRVRDAHLTWLHLKARWDASQAADRLALRWKAVALCARALPPARRIEVGSPGDLVAYARTAALLAGTQSGYAAWSNLARHPEALFAEVDAWLGPVEEGADHPLAWR